MSGYLFVHGRPYGFQDLRKEGFQVFAGEEQVFPLPTRPPEKKGRWKPTEEEELNAVLCRAARLVRHMQKRDMVPRRIAENLAAWLRRQSKETGLELEIYIDRFDYDVSVATPEMTKEGWDVALCTQQEEEISEEEWEEVQRRLEEGANSFLRMVHNVITKGGVVLIGYGRESIVPISGALSLLEKLVEASNPNLSLQEQIERVSEALALSRQGAREFLGGASHEYLQQALEQTRA